MIQKATVSVGKERTKLWQEVFKLSKRYHRKHILTRNKAQGKFPLNAQINMALRMDEMGCTKAHRVACLAYSDQLFDEQELVVKYAQAQGYSGKLFSEEDEALTWLVKSSPGKDSESKSL